MQHYKQLGALYLGQSRVLEQNARRHGPIFYSAKHPSAHALIVGRVGSRKAPRTRAAQGRRAPGWL